MNKFVERELNRCRVNLPEWNSDTTHLVIPFGIELPSQDGNKEYVISIKNYILHEPPNFTLSENWNHGTVPPEQFMTVKFVDKRGKLTKVSGVGNRTGIEWSGWLPDKGFEVEE